MTKKSTTLVYLSHVEFSSYGEYKHLTLTILPEAYERDNKPGLWSDNHDCTVRFRWQSSMRTDASEGWYALRIETECRGLDDHLAATAAVKRVMRGTEDCWNLQPGAVLDRLDKVKARELVYDGRESSYVELDQVKPPHFFAWRDDYRTMDRTSAMSGCVAASREDAQREIAVAMAEYSPAADYMADWLKAGRPVMQIGDEAPDTTTARERIQL